MRITNDGRKCALDQRLLNDMLPDAEGSKVNRCVENTFEVWKNTMQEKSAQLIFCGLSVPKAGGTFNVYALSRRVGFFCGGRKIDIQIMEKG